MKKKTEYINAFTRDVVSSLEFGYDAETAEAFFVTPMENESLVRTYERKKNDKVVSKIPYTGKNFSFSRDKSLWDNYDHLLSIDTNTRNIKGHEVSVTGVTHGRKIVSVDRKGKAEKSWYYYSSYCLEFTNCIEDKEKTGWWLAITYLLESDIYKKAKNIAIIVDCHLGDINNFNSRKSPVFKNLLLPEKLTIVYASADTGMDDFANKMIKFSDTSASNVFKILVKEWSFPDDSKVINMPFKTLRKIYSNEYLSQKNKKA